MKENNKSIEELTDEILKKCLTAKYSYRLLKKLAGRMFQYMKHNVLSSEDNEIVTIYDNNFYRELFAEHIVNKELEVIRIVDTNEFLSICGLNALGAGMHLMYLQTKTGKQVRYMTDEERMNIFFDQWKGVHSFEVGLECFGYTKDSYMAEVVDDVVNYSIQQYMKIVDRKTYNAEKATSSCTNEEYMDSKQKEMINAMLSAGVMHKPIKRKLYKYKYLKAFMLANFFAGATIANSILHERIF